MQREEFETRIRELLPGSSEIALATPSPHMPRSRMSWRLNYLTGLGISMTPSM